MSIESVQSQNVIFSFKTRTPRKPRTKSSYFQYKYPLQLATLKLLHADERLKMFALNAPGLGVISSIRLDVRSTIQFVKPPRSMVHFERKTLENKIDKNTKIKKGKQKNPDTLGKFYLILTSSFISSDQLLIISKDKIKMSRVKCKSIIKLHLLMQ